MKTCSTCKTPKSTSEFNKKSTTIDGLQERCRECFRAYNKRHYERNKEKRKAQVKAYVESQGGYEVINAKRKEYFQQHYQANREHVTARNKAYDQANPHVRAGIKARRLQRTILLLTQIDKRKARIYRERIKDNPCFYCEKIQDGMEYDHVFPLAKGGTDHWFNLVRACVPCNRRKSARLLSATF